MKKRSDFKSELTLCPMIFQRRLLYHSGSNLQFPFASLKHFLEPQLLIQQHFTALKVLKCPCLHLRIYVNNICFFLCILRTFKSLSPSFIESSGPHSASVESTLSQSLCLPAFFSFVSWGDPNARRAHAHSHICF